jgi:hypothetical protein
MLAGQGRAVAWLAAWLARAGTLACCFGCDKLNFCPSFVAKSPVFNDLPHGERCLAFLSPPWRSQAHGKTALSPFYSPSLFLPSSRPCLLPLVKKWCFPAQWP